MSTLQTARRLRLPLIVGRSPNLSAPANKLGGEVASWQGDALNVECAFCEADAETIITDVSAADSVTFEIFTAQSSTATLLASVTVSAASINTITQAAWDDGTGQHLTASFSASDMDINLSGAKSAAFWMVISMLPTTPGASPVTVWAGNITIYENATPANGAIYSNGNKVPVGAEYAADVYTLTGLIAGHLYKWTKKSADAFIVVDGVTYTAPLNSGVVFVAPLSGQITMNSGGGDFVIVDLVEYATVYTGDISDARYQQLGGTQFNYITLKDEDSGLYKVVKLKGGQILIEP